MGPFVKESLSLISLSWIAPPVHVVLGCRLRLEGEHLYTDAEPEVCSDNNSAHFDWFEIEARTSMLDPSLARNRPGLCRLSLGISTCCHAKQFSHIVVVNLSPYISSGNVSQDAHVLDIASQAEIDGPSAPTQTLHFHWPGPPSPSRWCTTTFHFHWTDPACSNILLFSLGDLYLSVRSR